MQTERLSLDYANKAAFKDVPQGQIRWHHGANRSPGCGKTSFLTCLNRLVERERGCKVSGRILLGNQDASTRCDFTCVVGWECSFKTRFRSIIRNIEFLREHGIRVGTKSITESRMSCEMWGSGMK